jgi:hypothetical protein
MRGPARALLRLERLMAPLTLAEGVGRLTFHRIADSLLT